MDDVPSDGHPVKLYIYDLSMGKASMFSALLGKPQIKPCNSVSALCVAARYRRRRQGLCWPLRPFRVVACPWSSPLC